MNVYEKLALVQQKLKAPKGEYSNFGKYRYHSCEDILEAVKPLLGRHKAVLAIPDCIEQVGDRVYFVAMAIFTDTESLEQISVTGRAREEAEKKGMDGSQVNCFYIIPRTRCEVFYLILFVYAVH